MDCFCTYFDRNYLPRGLALYRSLRKHCPEFKLWVLCMDEATHAAMIQLELPGVELIALRAFEKGDDSLLEAKQNRSRIEYYFTCTPSLPLYVLDHWAEVDLITYLDADLFFFSSPAPLFEELGDGSIAIIGHRFSANLRGHEVTGIYNVGWLSFRRDDYAVTCLKWWRSKCIEWCYDLVDDGRFADQKYLDDWPIRFHKVVVLEHRGANVAIWNVGNHHLRLCDRDTVMVDEHPLIFFHFHSLRQITPWLYDPGWTAAGVAPSRMLRGRIYHPYIRCLREVNRQLSLVSGSQPDSSDIRVKMKPDEVRVSLVRRTVRRIRGMYRTGRALVTGRYIILARCGQTRNPTTAVLK